MSTPQSQLNFSGAVNLHGWKRRGDKYVPPTTQEQGRLPDGVYDESGALLGYKPQSLGVPTSLPESTTPSSNSPANPTSLKAFGERLVRKPVNDVIETGYDIKDEPLEAPARIGERVRSYLPHTEKPHYAHAQGGRSPQPQSGTPDFSGAIALDDQAAMESIAAQAKQRMEGVGQQYRQAKAQKKGLNFDGAVVLDQGSQPSSSQPSIVDALSNETAKVQRATNRMMRKLPQQSTPRSLAGTTTTPMRRRDDLTTGNVPNLQNIVTEARENPDPNAENANRIRAQVVKERYPTTAKGMIGRNIERATSALNPYQFGEDLTKPDETIIGEEVNRRLAAQERATTPEMIAARKKFGALDPATRAASSIPATLFSDVLKGGAGAIELADVSGLPTLARAVGIPVDKAKDWLNAKGNFFKEAQSNPALNQAGEEIQRSLPEKVGTQLGEMGVGIGELILLKRATGLSMSKLMALEAGAKTSDLPVRERAAKVAESAAMGRILDGHLSRSASAALFGIPTAVQSGTSYLQGNTSGTDALINTGVQTIMGGVLGGKPKLTGETLTRVPDIEATLRAREGAVKPYAQPRDIAAENGEVGSELTPSVQAGIVDAPIENLQPEPVHHSVNQPRRSRNTEHGAKGQFKAGKVLEEKGAPPNDVAAITSPTLANEPQLESTKAGGVVNSAPFYHGTKNADVVIPSIEYATRSSEQYTPGIFLSTDRSLAAKSTGESGSVRELKLKPEAKLLNLEDPTNMSEANRLRQNAGLGSYNAGEWQKREMAGTVTNADIYHSIAEDLGVGDRRKLHEAIKKSGYDGFSYSAEKRESSDQHRHTGDVVVLLKDGLLTSTQQPIGSQSMRTKATEGVGELAPSESRSRIDELKGTIETSRNRAELNQAIDALGDVQKRIHQQKAAIPYSDYETHAKLDTESAKAHELSTLAHKTIADLAEEGTRANEQSIATSLNRITTKRAEFAKPASQGVADAAKVALEPPDSVIAQLNFGKEQPIDVKKGVYQTKTVRGKEYSFDLHTYKLSDGRERLVLSAGNPKELVDAGAVVRPVEGGVVVETIHGGNTGFEGLGGVLARQIAKRYGKIIPDINAPLSEAGRKATQKLINAQSTQRSPAQPPIPPASPSTSAPAVEQSAAPVSDRRSTARIPAADWSTMTPAEQARTRQQLEMEMGGPATHEGGLPITSRSQVENKSVASPSETFPQSRLRETAVPETESNRQVSPQRPNAEAPTLNPDIVPRSEGGPRQVEPDAKPSVTSARKADLASDRAELDLPELPQAERKGWQASLDNAKSRGLDQQANRLADEVLKSPRALNDEETAGMVLRLQQVKNEHAGLLKQVGEGDAEQQAATRVRLQAVEDEFDKLDTATKKSGTEKGRTLAAQKLTINQDFDLISLIQRAKARGIEITPSRRQKYADMVMKVGDLESQLAKAREENATKSVQQQIDSVRRKSNRQVRKGEITAQREAIKQSITAEITRLKEQSKQGQFLSQGGLGNLDPEGVITKNLVKYAKTLIDEGVLKAEDVIDRVHELVKDYGATRRQTAEALSGYGIGDNKAKLEGELARIRREIRETLGQQDVEAGRLTSRRAGPRQSEASQSGQPRQGPRLSDINKVPLQGPRLSDVRRLPALGPKLSDANRLPAQGPRITDAPFVGPRTSDVNRLRPEGPNIASKGQNEIRVRQLEKQAREIEQKIANKDYSPTVKREPVIYDAKSNRIQSQVEALKRQYQADLDANEKKSVGDYLVRWKRFAVLTYPTTFGKLATAAASRMSLSPVEELSDLALSRAPGFKQVARQSTMGQPSIKAEAKAIRQIWEGGETNGFKQTLEYLKTGHDMLDLLYGGKHADEFRSGDKILGAPGRAHGAVKEIPKRAAFYRSFEKRLALAEKQGADIADPRVQLAKAGEAYVDAQRAVLQQDNPVSKAFSQWVGGMERGKSGTMQAAGKALRFTFPITRVPVNFAGEAAMNIAGVPYAAARTGIRAMQGKLNDLSPTEADHIRRAYKIGGVGAAFLTWGILKPDQFGGYYQPGKRDESDLKAGEMKVFGQRLPRWLAHTPQLEAAQFGATIRRTFDKLRVKHPETSKTEAGVVGTLTAAKGLGEEIPFVQPLIDSERGLGSLFTHPGKFAANQVKGTIPGAIQWGARRLDTDTGNPVTGTTIPRPTSGFVDTLQEGIPGLRQRIEPKETKSGRPTRPTRQSTPRPKRTALQRMGIFRPMDA